MSDEKKDVNSQQENEGKKGINKKLIIAFAGMGAVIVCPRLFYLMLPPVSVQ